jgi:hypothetical protein
MAEAMQGSPEYYKGQYASLKFPPFKQQEYPKLIYTDETRKKVLGVANNAMEEKELYASIGVDKVDVDPLGAALDEVSVLRAKLALYEGSDASQQIAPQKISGVSTNTVEMLPESTPVSAPVANAPKAPNPLLKPAPQTAGVPQPQGSAPTITKTLSPGV